MKITTIKFESIQDIVLTQCEYIKNGRALGVCKTLGVSIRDFKSAKTTEINIKDFPSFEWGG